MNNHAQTPVGAWLVAVAMPGQDHFPGLLTFNSDGTLIASESPSPFESTGHGSWQMSAEGTVAYTFVALFGNAEGKNTGRLKIEIVDNLGQVTFAERGAFTLIRIGVEPLT